MTPALLQSGHAADRAALAWWIDAGVDTLVDAPRSWLRPAAAAVAQPITKQSAKPAAPPPVADDWAQFTDLAAFAAALPNAVLADGNPASGLMIVGEAPSAEDLRTRRPFTGPAGQLLDRMLAAIGRDRAGSDNGAYISLLCPRRAIPGTPDADAIAHDLPLMRAHIRLAAPRVLLLLGGPASAAITGERGAISALRGRWFDLVVDGHAVPALAMFNPAYLLRQPLAKREAWADLRALQARLAA
jgi:uracil-DNA glycosylase